MTRTLTYAFQGCNKRQCRKERQEIEWENREGELGSVMGDLKTQINNCP